MSGGKKKSSFQITSVTTDYEGPGSPGGPDSPALPGPTGPPPRLPNGEPNPESGGKSTPRNGSPPPGAPASRFRVVKLPQGLGEPYRRGRWTCVDVYERDLEPPGFGRVLEGIRGASGGTGGRSLDSRLELASLGLGAPIPQPGLSQGPTSWLLPPPSSPGLQARSPALYFFPDASLVHKSPDPFGAAAAQSLSLARSMLAISGHLDSDDDSGSGSLVGIDNKIEQAMDLVKSHLMFAVREEVEVLKEQIRDLAERNAALEQENGLLRALASPEQLAQLPSSGVPRLGPPAPNGPSI
uniref:TSC22 domain family member 4 n=1 Tax=Myotis myotis TaxID=51298 RepID=A0A7J7Y3D4_MYOMY|nr:TSC22 domain family member 4 [Myotis myotis]